jgi:hypothetical protein
VSTFLTEVRQTLVPDLNARSRHGPLPPLPVGLTFVTGLVDAFSYLVLGRLFFVVNMTGNVVFLGFRRTRRTCFSIADRRDSVNAGLVAPAITGNPARRHSSGFLGSRIGHVC